MTAQMTELALTAEQRTTLHCPDWCNRAHQAGANSRRQHHENVWRSAGGGYLPTKVVTFPCPPYALFDGGTWEVGSFMTVTVQSRDVHTVLTVSELRSLAERLTEIADAAQHGER